MTPDFCLVTAITPDFLPQLYWTAPTWAYKPQFANRPLLVFHHGFRQRELVKLDFLKRVFPAVVGVPWDMPQAANNRERMISAFVLGVEHIQSEYFVKLDADMYFSTPEDVFTEDHFKYDLVAQRWHYTKPGYMIDCLEAWSQGKPKPPQPVGQQSVHRKAPRIISYCCLHRTEFVRKAAKLAGDRLPVPSHDTYLWWLADNCRDFSWLAIDQKARGVCHGTHRYRRIRNAVCEGEAVWNPVHNESLLDHIQLEITTACNLACPNCDRACGVAPSKEHLTVDDVKRFVAESIELKKTWQRIDILGGEPTLHPDLLTIIELVKPITKRVRLTTNGTSDKVKAVLATVPDWVWIRNSADEKAEPNFTAFNSAPVDAGITEAKSCSVPWRCGIALTPGGYFLCGAGGAVSRVFGLRLGIQELANVSVDSLRQQRAKLCRLCGHSRSTAHQTTKQEISPSWEKAIKEYNKC